jgi:hypothetical protein
MGVARRFGQGLWINEAGLAHGVSPLPGMTLARLTLKV